MSIILFHTHHNNSGFRAAGAVCHSRVPLVCPGFLLVGYVLLIFSFMRCGHFMYIYVCFVFVCFCFCFCFMFLVFVPYLVYPMFLVSLDYPFMILSRFPLAFIAYTKAFFLNFAVVYESNCKKMALYVWRLSQPMDEKEH